MTDNPTDTEIEMALALINVETNLADYPPVSTLSDHWFTESLSSTDKYDVRRLPPLSAMDWTENERERLNAYMHQAVRYRRTNWWRRLVDFLRGDRRS